MMSLPQATSEVSQIYKKNGSNIQKSFKVDNIYFLNVKNFDI